ncbi:DNA-binding transcriptional LysR family regulator [Paraburkholderia youngii]|uniref:LysR family transcriptional regulator n=1 Tax=Paraburkholderia youngii TaxID=2782701 RepID=A0ABX2NDL0_9BURK|nr:LysR family transcriptional regulator [Paraburkholderia youngii]NVI02386.1 LysR family transcriptional regulator [Paraburkholderia youngii]
MDRFSSMAIFARVVEYGSFTAAAEGSGMTPTMVGNHIRELERRVSCPVIYGTRVLVPALAAYLDRYPDVQVELSLSDRYVDLAEEGFDAAIRAGVLPDSGLIARPLTRSPRIACASPAYLARCGHPKVPADLVQHNCLAFMLSNGPEREWRFLRPDSNVVERIAVRGRLDVNGGLALREAALAELGVIFQPQVMLQEDLDAGRPIRLFPDWPAQTWPVHVVHLPDAHMPPKLASFIAFLQETLGHDSQP